MVKSASSTTTLSSAVGETVDSAASADQVLLQLKRIRGQIDGVIEMYQSERACIDIVRQVIAARSSLGRVSRDLLTCEANKCSQERRTDDLGEVLKELFRY